MEQMMSTGKNLNMFLHQMEAIIYSLEILAKIA